MKGTKVYITNLRLDEGWAVNRVAQEMKLQVEFRRHPMPTSSDDFWDEGDYHYDPRLLEGVYGSVYCTEPLDKDLSDFWKRVNEILGK
jgi:hypothetical protein